MPIQDEQVQREMATLSSLMKKVFLESLSAGVVNHIVENVLINLLSPFVKEKLDKGEVENAIHQEIMRSVGPFIQGEIMATDMREVIQAAIVEQVRTLLAKQVSDIIREELVLIMGELNQQDGKVSELARRLSHLEGQMSILIHSPQNVK